ncbi:MAG: regulatory protein TetR [Actinomycetia bacterium]|nr:regulatory protein TetR [Actinomycetes bacterium]
MAFAKEATAAAGWEDRALDRSLSAARGRSATRARRLVDAARSLATELGSSQFTVAEVSSRADVSLRSFYRHFAGKDELLLALLEEEARTGAELLRLGLESIDDPLERVRAFVLGICSLLVTGSGYSSLLVREHLRLGEQHPDEVRAALAPIIDVLDRELTAAARAGEVRPVDRHDAVMMFTVVLAHVHASFLFGPLDDLETSATRLWDFCRSGLAPSSS